MAYVDQHAQFRLKPVAAVALVHLAIGYAFISGLAGEIAQHVPAVFRVISIDAPVPPPPNDPPPPPARAEPQQRVTAPAPTIDLPRAPEQTVIVPMLPPLPSARSEPPAPLPLPPATTLGQSPARAKGDRSTWITADDYPSRSLRNAEEGVVAISARIGADGRVSDCAITASSGFPLLDEAACRLYQRRARFTPARDPAGHPVASTTTDRIRWTIPR